MTTATPTVAQTCASYSFCTATAWSGTSSYPITHICHVGHPTITVSFPDNTGHVSFQTTAPNATGTVTVYETDIIQTSFQATSTSPICSEATQTLAPYGSLVVHNTTSIMSTPAPPVLTGSAGSAAPRVKQGIAFLLGLCTATVVYLVLMA
ncbi:hypothetical protein EJ05DRAFT_473632, partial [Pseudovirgaria hyperparasitica]